MARSLRLVLVLFTLICMYPLSGAAQDNHTPSAPLQITRITPTGEDVEAARQIVIEFNRPVVPLGIMDRQADDLGITITPPVACQWRWLNTSSLGCNLGEEDSLKRATRYTIVVSPKIQAEDGAMIEKPYESSFITQRAAVRYAYLIRWASPQIPIYEVYFDQPVTQNSVAQSLSFVKATGRDGTPQENDSRLGVKVKKINDESDRPILIDGQEALQRWQIEPDQPLDPETYYVLVGGNGLRSAEGPERSTLETTILKAYTFGVANVKGVSCKNNYDQDILIEPGKPPQSENEYCNPLSTISLVFTTPIFRENIKKELSITPALGDKNDLDQVWGEDRNVSRLSDSRSDGYSVYPVNLPFGLKAAQEYKLILAPTPRTLWQKFLDFVMGRKVTHTPLSDEFGRVIPPFEITFQTNHRKPNYEMIHRNSVLEYGIENDLPLFVNNLEDYSLNYTRFTAQGVTTHETGPFKIPFVQDKQFAIPMGIPSALEGKSGVIAGTFSTSPTVNGKWERANSFFTQITPFQIYAKIGHFSSTVWVTDFAKGMPVDNATVTLLSGTKGALGTLSVIGQPVTTTSDGLARFDGTTTFDPLLTLKNNWDEDKPSLFLRVQKDDHIALLPLMDEYEVQLWDIGDNIYDSSERIFGHMKSWGMTAQGIYRAGDTIQYKLFLRNQDNTRLVAPPKGEYTLEISDPSGKVVSTLEKINFTEFGTYAGEYAVLKNAAIGWYSFKLSAQFNDTKDDVRTFYPLSVLVSDFTPAPFRVTTDVNGTRFSPGDTLEVSSLAQLHSGGAYSDAAVKGSIALQSKLFSSDNPKAVGFSFDSFKNEQNFDYLAQKEGILDDQGTWKETLTLPVKDIVYGDLIIETSVRDDRGKSIASMVKADYVGVDRLVGLKSKEWVFAAQTPAIIESLVVDKNGVPIANTPIQIVIEQENVFTAKVKSAGNAYLDDITREWVKISECTLTSTTDALPCTFTPEKAGTYRAVATISDTKGQSHSTTLNFWVTGPDVIQWATGSQYALPIIPEKNDYAVGDTARFLVKNPFPGAKAYISVERYGVLDHFVQTLSDSTAIIELPIQPDYLPGIYVSVVVMSPRVEAPPPGVGQLDLGKPTFRVGYVRLPLKDPHKEMVVEAKADQEEYRPRDLVKVTINAKPRHEIKQKEPIELAVAVLDESVFDLIRGGRTAFDPYAGFYDLDSLDVTNYSLLTRLIGRQKFEKKGANPGGDGGVDLSTRNIFQYVSYWNPSVPIDANGRATLEFEAPDNLTGWRILAIATTPHDIMGLGEGTFKVNRPTEIRPSMPNQVREQDDFTAAFTVMNRTGETRTLDVTIEAKDTSTNKRLSDQTTTITLEPYKRQMVTLDLKAPLVPITRDVEQTTLAFTITAGDELDIDRLDHTLPVLKSRNIETAATYTTSTEPSTQSSIRVPRDVHTDSVNLSLTLSPTILGNLDGAFEYMRDYPYSCWEQKLSTAAMAAHYTALEPYLTLDWPAASTLPQSTLDLAGEYQAPNGGMTYFKAQDEYVDPYLSAYTALAFGWLKADGYFIPSGTESALHAYLSSLLKTNIAPSYYDEDMLMNVRVAAMLALKDTGKVTAQDALRFREKISQMDLFTKANYLLLTSHFDTTKETARDVLNALLSSSVESGGKISFNQTYTDGMSRILATPLRDQCRVLEALSAYPIKDIIGDKPMRLVRSITQTRGNRDHWENTQENMFCMQALKTYAKEFEQVTPSMTIMAKVDDQTVGAATFKAITDPAKTLIHALGEPDLGQDKNLTLEKNGDGRYYAITRLRYAALTPQNNMNAGFDVRREYSVRDGESWALVKGPITLKRGDLVRVDLFISIPTARNFVVVHDPLPGGLEILNRDLATTSDLDARESNFPVHGGSYYAQKDDWQGYNFSFWGFYHQEMRHDSARFYADWLEGGNYHLSYMAQAIATGTFTIPPTHAEEMYDPDVFGRGEAAILNVEEIP